MKSLQEYIVMESMLPIYRLDNPTDVQYIADWLKAGISKSKMTIDIDKKVITVKDLTLVDCDGKTAIYDDKGSSKDYVKIIPSKDWTIKVTNSLYVQHRKLDDINFDFSSKLDSIVFDKYVFSNDIKTLRGASTEMLVLYSGGYEIDSIIKADYMHMFYDVITGADPFSPHSKFKCPYVALSGVKYASNKVTKDAGIIPDKCRYSLMTLLQNNPKLTVIVSVQAKYSPYFQVTLADDDILCTSLGTDDIKKAFKECK